MDDRSFALMLQRATEAPPPDVVARIAARLGAAPHRPASLIDAPDLRGLEPDRPDDREGSRDRARRCRRLAAVAAAVMAAAAIGISVIAIEREDGSPADEPAPSLPPSTSVVPASPSVMRIEPIEEELPPSQLAFGLRMPSATWGSRRSTRSHCDITGGVPSHGPG